MTELVAADIGGTHARFALATLAPDGTIALDEPLTLRTGDFPDLPAAWKAFEQRTGRPLPRAAAIAIAATTQGDVIGMTNANWTLRISQLAGQLDVDRLRVVNDFEAVAHAAACTDGDQFIALSGPDAPLPATGTISVVGPGTGLGVAHFHRFANSYHVQACEGGHMSFAPVDAVDDAILAHVRTHYPRVSVERIVSGPGLTAIYETLAARAGCAVLPCGNPALWQRGLAGEDKLAAAAIERFCMALGTAAGDLALAQGASGVVIAGGLGLRLRSVLPGSGFAERFCDKGRYDELMSTIPVRLFTHPQPGLFGAVAAFAQDHGAP